MTITDHRTSTHRASLISTVVDTYRGRRTARAMYRTAEKELSAYTTEADLQELGAMLERSDSEDTGIYGEIIERMRFRDAA